MTNNFSVKIALFDDEPFMLKLLGRMLENLGRWLTVTRSGRNCGQLTGRMVDQSWGDICDGEEKRRALLQTCESLGIAPSQTIAVGDGANDLPIMSVAGLSVAYHAKPKVREQAIVAINSGGLDRLLEVVKA